MGDNKYNIAFLILHYKELDITKRCIDSALKYNNCRIYVVDNGSNNGSGEKLAVHYENNKRVSIFKTNNAWGFSRGNNWGYECVKKNGDCPDFLVVCNNDLVFEQNDFIEKLIEGFKKHNATVIGPDILMYSNRAIHQNPLMLKARNKDEISNYKKSVECSIKHVNKIALENQTKSLIKKVIHKKVVQYNLPNFNYAEEKKDVCLCGACLIYTPLFFEKYNDGLFTPETQFYHEEEILFYRLKKNNDFMLYDPNITVLHDHSVSTKNKFKSTRERLLFQYQNNVNSCNVLLKMLSDEY